MKNTEIVNQIKTLLNIQVKLEDMKLENGTVVSAESFEKGKEIFIVTDDERVAMPVGEYLLEDGRLVVVQEEGIIADVREVSDEVPAKEEASEEEEKETTEDLAKEEEEKEKDNYEEEEEEKKETSLDMEDMERRIQNLEDAIADLKADKVEASEVSVMPKSRTVKEEFSEAAAKPIKHNPESKSVPTRVYAESKVKTTLDRVLTKLSKN